MAWMPRDVLFASLLAFTHAVSAEGQATLDADELQALTAAMQQTQSHDPSGWLLIDAQTAAFPCDPGEPRVVVLDGCSGMAPPGQEPAEMLALVKEAIPAVNADAMKDFQAKSSASILIDKPLAIPTRQVIWSPADPAGFPTDLGKPEAALNLSRVGFDAGRTCALLYIGSISYTHRDHSFGEYVYLTKTNGSWSVQGTMQAWKMGR
ncbi:MAG: hypothetical protein HYY48_05480 [Gammaproteobacteria bacterium]|nr:hypothetical protein [Gammaproteobacteria bacterium]